MCVCLRELRLFVCVNKFTNAFQICRCGNSTCCCYCHARFSRPSSRGRGAAEQRQSRDRAEYSAIKWLPKVYKSTNTDIESNCKYYLCMFVCMSCMNTFIFYLTSVYCPHKYCTHFRVYSFLKCDNFSPFTVFALLNTFIQYSNMHIWSVCIYSCLCQTNDSLCSLVYWLPVRFGVNFCVKS